MERSLAWWQGQTPERQPRYDRSIRPDRPSPHNRPQRAYARFFEAGAFDALQARVLPRKLLVDSVNVCNARCVFCAYPKREDPKSILDGGLLESAARQLVAMHPESFVSLTPTVGDPLLDPAIFDKVRRLKALGVARVQFYTNGILLPERHGELADSPLDNLELSLPDFDPDRYAAIFGVDRYERVLDGLCSLLLALRERESPLTVHVNVRGNRPLAEVLRAPDFLERVAPLCDDRVFFGETAVFDNWMGLITETDLLPGMTLAEDRKDDAALPCRRTFDLQLLPNGDLRLCGCRFGGSVYDDLVIGNLHDADLEAVWFSERAYALRASFFERRYPAACVRCSYYQPVGDRETRRFYLREEP